MTQRDIIDLNATPARRPVRVLPRSEADKIVARVAAKHGLTLADLKGPDKTKRVTHPRQQAMAELYATGRYSLPALGRYFGGRDHSTVLHGVKAHWARIQADREAA
jgi:chromosomal replication initiator protein